jgi:hypothetical protein
MTVTLTIGSGKDYATVQDAWNSLSTPITEPYIFEMYAGTYTGKINFSGSKTSATNTVTIKKAATPGGTVELKSNQAGYMFTFNNQYIRIENNIIINIDCINDGTYMWSADMVNAKIDRCFIKADVHAGVYNGPFQDQLGGTLSNCYFYAINAGNLNALYIESCSTSKVYNNTFYIKRVDTSREIFNYRTGALVKNNIFLTDLYTGGVVDAPNNSNFNYNLVWSLAGSPSDTVYNSNIKQNPGLTDPNNLDFTIGTSSPAKNVGTDLSSAGVTNDYTNFPRPFGDNWDIGAYEYHPLLLNFFRIGTKDEIAFIKGYMDEIRVSKGKARWTTDFTPPNTYYS